jgi:type VI secretion system protein ImpM
MNANMQIGLYGKLPAYGDFIFRNLNSTFINSWDEWLQQFIATSREQIGEAWLDIYLTSPIWEFALSPGVIDSNMWAGIIMPSVDRVGRYFPVSIVQPLSASESAVHFVLNQDDWYEKLETQCLLALDGKIDADELVAAVAEIQPGKTEIYQPTQNLGEAGPMIFGLSAFEKSQIYNAIPYLLNATLTNGLASFSLWKTAGSELISPTLFCCQGLPPMAGIASMLDGQWQRRNWKIPYNLQASAG